MSAAESWNPNTGGPLCDWCGECDWCLNYGLSAAGSSMARETPPPLCAFSLHRGRYCVLPYQHGGEHQPALPMTADATNRCDECSRDLGDGDGGLCGACAWQADLGVPGE